MTALSIEVLATVPIQVEGCLHYQRQASPGAFIRLQSLVLVTVTAEKKRSTLRLGDAEADDSVIGEFQNLPFQNLPFFLAAIS